MQVGNTGGLAVAGNPGHNTVRIDWQSFNQWPGQVFASHGTRIQELPAFIQQSENAIMSAGHFQGHLKNRFKCLFQAKAGRNQ